MYCSDVETPQGKIRVVADDESVVAVAFYPGTNLKLKGFGLTGTEKPNAISRTAAGQLEAYFSGELTSFDLPVDFGDMTEFAQAVLGCLMQVPYGEVVSYATLAAMSGRPKAARAVGRIMAGNPIPVIVPCHRVVGSTGKMTGYSGGEGIVTKQWLLDLEHRNRVS